jgi:MFS family permease
MIGSLQQRVYLQMDRPRTIVENIGISDKSWLIGMSIVIMLTLQPFSSYVASVPFIRQEWGLSHTQAGIVFSVYLVGYAISSVFLLPLTDKIAPVRVMLAGVFIVAISNLLFPLLAWNFWSGTLLRAVAGVGHVAAYIPGVQLVSQRYRGAKRATAVSIFVGAGYAGITLSYTFMGSLLNYTESWRTSYFITALVSFGGALLIIYLMRYPARQPYSPRPVKSGTGRLDVTVLREKSVILVVLSYALHTAELYLARLWFPLLLGAALMQQGRTELAATAQAATLSGLMFTTGIAGVLIGGVLSDKIGRSYGAVLIFGSSGLCSFVAGWLLNVPVGYLIVLGFFYGFFTAADSAIYLTAVTELSPPGRTGSTQAVQSFLGFIIGAVLPVAAGAILDFAPTGLEWGLAFSLNGLLAVMGITTLFWLRRLPQAAKMAVGKR